MSDTQDILSAVAVVGIMTTCALLLVGRINIDLQPIAAEPGGSASFSWALPAGGGYGVEDLTVCGLAVAK